MAWFTCAVSTKHRLAVESLAFYDNRRAVPALLKAAKINGPVGAEATRWLIHLGNTRWRKFRVFDSLKEEGIYDPTQVKITEIIPPSVV